LTLASLIPAYTRSCNLFAGVNALVCKAFSYRSCLVLGLLLGLLMNPIYCVGALSAEPISN